MTAYVFYIFLFNLKNQFVCFCSNPLGIIANEPAERRREAGEAAAL